ncbi:glycosyltransferase family 2 protein [Pedobacter insulae]|uniref:Glycosyltransferase involved in cell wall bisynthesis n=1 Tax=Pedobacter insulae TaxID=414048 RepID=A0A1I2VUP6_9SPHI|nr:glycosyltransferase family 2 protein [Pedobacter insulae]SFG92862.1 Glycosyltransferase involved in cell wall bisynthesis [Pedobacter insulae]
MKISIITVVYNGKAFLEDCIKSVIEQTYPEIEYIVIDGGSKDGSLEVIEKYKAHIDHFVSEKDEGMYDALNKGIRIATGEVVGILNADDMLAAPDVIESIANCFTNEDPDALFGNLNYIDPINTSKIVRKWIAKPFTKSDIVLGWMPAHPTFYVKRSLFEELGYYSLNFDSAADYELMLRFLYKNHIKAVFLDKLIVRMRTGGMSNASMKHRYKALINDYKALKSNHIPFAFLTIILKKLSKIKQFI